MRINGLLQHNYSLSVVKGWLVLLLLAILLQGCSAGFKPRGADSLTQLPLRGLSVLISSEQQPSFARVLRSGLEDSGAQLVGTTAPGVIVLNIVGLEEDKTVSAYSAIRQVREFNHYIELDFSASRQLSGVKPRQVTAKVRAERSQIYDSQYVLGANEEERAIQNELRKEVVRLLALRLGVLR